MPVKFKIDERKLMREVQKQATSKLSSQTYEVECPHCRSKIQVPVGKSLCPICRNEINLNLDITFEG